GNVLAYVSVGDRPRDIERLVSAFAEIRRLYKRDTGTLMTAEYISPRVLCSPQDAFYSDKQALPLRQCENAVCAEFVMCYPPGIPILAPGELITRDILDYIVYAKEKGCSMTGPADMEIEQLNVLKGMRPAACG
ncbi:MAG: arginine decarboxylase, partial [Lachnospiraceae bacterium]|nr:arginine decarboxylase [Lachnospiraceae bacterium]